MKKLRFGIIGAGGIADRRTIPGMMEAKNVEVVAVMEINADNAERLRAKYNAKFAYTDAEELVKNPEVDAVYVLTPNYAHYTITMDALRAGKHVFCEKPITVNYALSCEMAEEARRQNKIVTIGVVNRYNKSVEMLEELNRQGRFGKIYHVYCSFRSFRSIPGLGGAFTNKAESGGGVLIDWGVHFFDLVLYILGGAKVNTVSCDAYCELAKDMKSYKYESMWAEDTADIENGINDVDDFISGYVRTDKASISFNGAWAQNVGVPEMFIDFLGDKGGARLEYGNRFTFWDGETLQSFSPESDLPNQWAREDAAFIEAIRTGNKTKNNIGIYKFLRGRK